MSNVAHPELHDHAHSHEAAHMNLPRAKSCSAERIIRRQASLGRRRDSLLASRAKTAAPISKRNVYSTIQNTTYFLPPETVWGPYVIDGEIKRHDVCEYQQGVYLYLDIGVIDFETASPCLTAG